jgi:hypothetical protein
LLYELLKEVRHQHVLINRLTEAINEKNAKQKKKIIPEFESSTPCFKDIGTDFDLTISELLRFNKTSFVKSVAELLKKILLNTGTVAVVDKARKIFYLKLSHCWCSEMKYNNELLDRFTGKIILQLIKKTCDSDLSVMQSNEVTNAILKGKSEDDVYKKIRYKFINIF